MYKVLSLVIISFFAFTPFAGAINVEYVGFLQSSVWFEKEPFFAGKPVRVYTALANSTEADVTGTVKFLSNGSEIGSGDVVLERQGGFQVIWTDWVPAEGSYTVTAEFVNVIATEPGQAPQEILYTGAVASADPRSVDSDTDGDGIGNATDTDDDGDGIVDSEDSAPLVANLSTEVTTENSEGDGFKKVEDAVEKVAEIATEAANEFGPIAKSTTEKVVDTLEKTRLEQGAKVDEARERLKEKLEEEQSGVELPDGEEVSSTPFGAMRLAALTAASYTLNNAYAFYVALMVALYFIVWRGLGWFFRKMRGNRDEF